MPKNYDEWRERMLELASMECPSFDDDEDAAERIQEFLEFERKRKLRIGWMKESD